MVGLSIGVLILLSAIALANRRSNQSPVVPSSDQQAATAWVQRYPQMATLMQDHRGEMTLMHEHWGDLSWMQANLDDYAWMQGHWVDTTWMHDHGPSGDACWLTLDPGVAG